MYFAVSCVSIKKYNNAFFVLSILLKTILSSVLDISQTESYPEQGVYKDENKTLAMIVNSLPNLMSLDISGTNLAGKGKLFESQSLIPTHLWPSDIDYILLLSEFYNWIL